MKRTAIARRTPLKRKPWRRALGTPELRLAFKQEVCRGGACVMAGRSACSGPLQACHVVRKETLRRLGFGAEVVYAPRLGFCGCERHHNRHDRGLEPVPSSLVTEQVAYAESLGLGYLLWREAA